MLRVKINDALILVIDTKDERYEYLEIPKG